ncbi:TRAM domain-containing protein [Candidatus Curtissbacteria bacterium]|nr:TRAM domain-containing protein [Candidatus Curtissbacteria bacterium]
MKPNRFARSLLAVFFGAVGVLIAQIVPPRELFFATGNYFFILAAIAFGILGFISPDLLKLAGKAGMSAISRQIASYLPQVSGNLRRKTSQTNKYINPVLVDTSVLVDGRIVEISASGFMFGTLLLMPSVIGELHRLSDSADEIKRARGRRGLDNLRQIQAEKNVKVEVLSFEPREGGVDEKLVRAAKSIGAKILTLDYNLNKVARVNKIKVLNINELASAVKTVVLPNERLNIKITAVGREKDQGVGYLDDGTMVVVEAGRGLLGKKVDVVVQKVLQTAAGKMVFGRIDESMSR